MNKQLMTDMADANGLQRAIGPTGFFNIKKMAADFCSAQCITDNTGYLMEETTHTHTHTHTHTQLVSFAKQWRSH